MAAAPSYTRTMLETPRTPPGWTLALDGATEALALALVGPAGERWSRELPGGAQASRLLLPGVQALLQQAGVPPTQIEGLAYGRGPGAFTGLRAVCAVVQGLAEGWGCGVRPLDSLLIPVQQAAVTAPDFDDWAVAVDARMGEWYAARYRRLADGGWHAVEPAALWAPQDLTEHWAKAPPQGLAGGWPGARAPALGRAEALALLAAAPAAAWQAAHTALPLYVRDKVALTTVERAQAAAQPLRSA